MNMKSALNAVWEGIGPDVLDSYGGNPTLNGHTVGQIVADYAQTYLYGEELESWKNASWEQRTAWLSQAFPSTQKYGW